MKCKTKDHLLDSKIGIWRNDGSARKIDSLSGQVAAKATLFALQALDEAPGELLRRLIGGNSGQLAVEVQRALQLQEVPVVLRNTNSFYHTLPKT